MKNKLSCAVVRDILPLYIEELTSEETNIEVSQHLEECSECKKLELSMKSEMKDEVIEGIEDEIDGFKIIKRRNKKKVLLSAGISFVLLLIFVGAIVYKTYLKGSVTDRHNINYKYISVLDNKLELELSLKDKSLGITNYSINEKDGVVTVNIMSAPKSTFSKSSIDIEKKYKKKIKKVMIMDAVIWEDDFYINEPIIEIFCNKTTGVEDKEKLTKLMDSVSTLVPYLGVVLNDTKASGDACGVMLKASKIKGTSKEEAIEYMNMYSCYMFAAVYELNYIEWKYRLKDGKEETYYLELDEACKLLNVADIKIYGTSAANLERLGDAIVWDEVDKSNEKYGFNDGDDTDEDAESGNINLEEPIINGKKLTLAGSFWNNDIKVDDIKVKENKGVVVVDILVSDKKLIEQNDTMPEDILIEETFENNITRVYFCGDVIYDGGVLINDTVARVYSKRLDDMTKDNEKAEKLIYAAALNYRETFEIDKVDVKDKTVNVIINFDDENQPYEEDVKLLMKQTTYLAYACIGNLEGISWNYNIDNKDKTYSLSLKEVNEFVKDLDDTYIIKGKNIRDIGRVPKYLQVLYDAIDLNI